MTRYFFDLRDGDGLSSDEEGTELDGVGEVRKEITQPFRSSPRSTSATMVTAPISR